jgi:hypothetical protein
MTSRIALLSLLAINAVMKRCEPGELPGIATRRWRSAGRGNSRSVHAKTSPYSIMSKPKSFGGTGTGKYLYFMPLSRFSEWPKDLQLRSKHIRLFVACDARRLRAATIRQFASLVIQQGVVDVSVWGPNCCEGFHIPFVEAMDPRLDASALITANCNSRDSLREALSSFIKWGFVSSQYKRTSKSLLFVAVGNPHWSKSVCQGLAAHVASEKRRRDK